MKTKKLKRSPRNAKTLEFEGVNPPLKEISKILLQKKMAGFDLTRCNSRISFSADVDIDPQDPEDWKLLITSVPNINSHEHTHFELDEKEMLKLRKYVDVILERIAKVRGKNSR